MEEFLNLFSQISPEVFAGFVSVLMVPVVDIVKAKLGTTNGWSLVVAVATSFLIGLVATVLEAGGFEFAFEDVNTLFTTLSSAFLASQIAYQTYWKPKGFSETLVKKVKAN